jgi:stage V sporulation protein G
MTGTMVGHQNQGGESMKITEVRISLRDDDKLKAFVSITLDNCFVVRGLKIIKGNRGMFVAMPSRKRPDGTFQDLAHPINNETRSWMEEEILTAYRQEVESQMLVK